ncbi:MAG: VWA domain-containing protein [Desulfobulbaceae bacterium]|nr:MAG: VWA domain-containing protein [Desulfobulbaceae bacterium]
MKKLKSIITTRLFFLALAVSICAGTTMGASPASAAESGQVINVDTRLVHNKVLIGSDGKVSMEITLSALDLPDYHRIAEQPVDLIVVLDRSGSMSGQKIHDARTAVLRLLDKLTGIDRFSLISYANNVYTHTPLVPMNYANTDRLRRQVANIRSGGGTNLGGGLQRGVNMFMSSYDNGRQRKIILISDGLANQGITDPYRLGAMASNGPEYNFSVSSVGVGYDFNEILMTTIADHGGGNYYFLENPEYFADVFEKEFKTARRVAANGIEIRIRLQNGVTLSDGGGYPIKMDGNTAIIRPGDLLSGQKRSFFLTYHVPTSQEQNVTLGDMIIDYRHQGTDQRVEKRGAHSVACVSDSDEVLAGIDKEAWSRQVVKDEYNKMKEKVADAVRSGNKDDAMETISEYESKTRGLNETLSSAEVAENLDEDVSELKQQVEETFTGAPAAVIQKQKKESKAMQYESYRIRRDKK